MAALGGRHLRIMLVACLRSNRRKVRGLD